MSHPTGTGCDPFLTPSNITIYNKIMTCSKITTCNKIMTCSKIAIRSKLVICSNITDLQLMSALLPTAEKIINPRDIKRARLQGWVP